MNWMKYYVNRFMVEISNIIYLFVGLQSQNIIAIGDPAGEDAVAGEIKIATMEGTAVIAKAHIDIVNGKVDIVGTGMMEKIQNQVDIVEAHIRDLEVEHPILHLIELDQMSNNPLVMAANAVIVLRIPLQSL